MHIYLFFIYTDYVELEKSYLSSNPELIYYDNFLSPEALDLLYNFLLESTLSLPFALKNTRRHTHTLTLAHFLSLNHSLSLSGTIWYDRRASYIGAYFDTGLYGELILQLIEELKEKFPNVLKGKHLARMWAYKYDNTLPGIKMHADQAHTNLNFWVTPSEANLDESSGGLEVWAKEAPDHWDFAMFNDLKYQCEVKTFLKESNAEKVIIPHKQNRMVMFNSNLFHQSDHKGINTICFVLYILYLIIYIFLPSHILHNKLYLKQKKFTQSNFVHLHIISNWNI